MSARSDLVEKLKNKKYRSAYIRSQIDVGVPMQIKFLRENLGLTQGALGKKAGMKQPRISAMERPGEVRFNIETLIRLASAFDVGLIVRFAPFSEMLNLEDQFSPTTFNLPTFDNDARLLPPEIMPTSAGVWASLGQQSGAVILPTEIDIWRIPEANVVQRQLPQSTGVVPKAIPSQAVVPSGANASL